MMRKKQDREAHVASKKLCKDVFERAARLMAGPGAAGRRKALHTGEHALQLQWYCVLRVCAVGCAAGMQ